MDKAYFLFLHAHQYNFQFQAKIKHAFKKTGFEYKGNIQTNLVKVGQKIRGNEFEPNGAFRVYDMIRAKFVVSEFTEIVQAYKLLQGLKDLAVVRLQDNLEAEANVVVNLVYQDVVVVEIVIEQGTKTVSYEPSQLLKSLISADKAQDFNGILLGHCNGLAENG